MQPYSSRVLRSPSGAFFKVRVCDQQLTEAAIPVEVCRHLQATDPPVIAVALVALASLGAFFTEISGFGLSFKRQVRDAKEAVLSANEAAESAFAASSTAEKMSALAKITADNAAGAAKSAEQAAQVGEELSLKAIRPVAEAPILEFADEQTELVNRIQVLADEYQATRDAMSPGSDRTSQMTSIVSKMIAALSGASPHQFAVSEYIEVAVVRDVAYLHYNMNYRQQTFLGQGFPVHQQDNYLSVRHL